MPERFPTTEPDPHSPARARAGSLSLAVRLWLALYSTLVSAVSPRSYKWHR